MGVALGDNVSAGVEVASDDGAELVAAGPNPDGWTQPAASIKTNTTSREERNVFLMGRSLP